MQISDEEITEFVSHIEHMLRESRHIQCTCGEDERTCRYCAHMERLQALWDKTVNNPP